jgi:hypothetical protein
MSLSPEPMDLTHSDILKEPEDGRWAHENDTTTKQEVPGRTNRLFYFDKTRIA